MFVDYGATEETLRSIQMYLLVIGSYGIFMSTYVISIIAAAYGVTKFFRLGHARVVTKIFSRGFIGISFISTAFMVLKGVVLAGIIYGRQTPLVESMLWWILFTILPTTILVIISSFLVPCYRMYTINQKMASALVGGGIPRIFISVTKMIAKQPSIILSPHCYT